MPSKRKKDIIIRDLSIEAIGFEGVAVGRHEEIVCFVKGAVPGDVIDAKVKRKKKKYYECRVEQIHEFSADRVEPPCSHFGVCGGCTWQQLDYDKQLFWKRRNIEDLFRRIAKIEVGEYLPYLFSEYKYGYRNKMEFSFSANRWLTDEEIAKDDEISDKYFALGLHLPGRFDKILNIENCYLQQNAANIILNEVRTQGYAVGMSAYHVTKHHGFLRHLTIRYSLAQDAFMVILTTAEITNDSEMKFVNDICRRLIEIIPNMKSFVHALNISHNAVMIDSYKILHGDEYLVESVCGVDFRISPFSFFQTNSYMLNPFIGKIVESAAIRPDDIVWDLYCGTGSISLPASKSAKSVFGLELSESSIADAKANAEFNGIENCVFSVIDLHGKNATESISQLPSPDVIIVDPPRAGIAQNIIDILLNSDCRRIVYVSCNPATQARDCALLTEKYKVTSILPVDMFPQTYHIESIAILDLIL